MATRFYLPNTGAAAVSPPWSAGWMGTDVADRRRCAIAKQNTSMATAVRQTSQTSANTDVAARMYVSDPLLAQTITDTVKGQIRAAQDNTTYDHRAQLAIRVVSGDGATDRGTLLAPDGGALASEFSTSLVNRKFPLAWVAPGNALGSVNALAGDRLVIEIGWRRHSTYRWGSIRFGDAAATDLPEDETTTTDLNPWIEFSQTLAFQAVAGGAMGAIAAHHFRQRRR
jgi:hypothetical protein